MAVFLVCYDVSNYASFLHVTSKWLPEVLSHCPNTPVVVVGLKEDLRDNPEALDKAGTAFPPSLAEGNEVRTVTVGRQGVVYLLSRSGSIF